MIIKQGIQLISRKINRISTDTKLCRSLTADTVEFSSKKVKSPKDIILQAIGENHTLSVDITDFGGIYSTKILFKNPKQHYIYIDPQKSKRGKPHISGHISCHYNKNKQLEKFYVFDWETKSIRVFDKDGKIVNQFTPEETVAMMKYKSNSKKIHRILRGGKSIKNENEVRQYIKDLSALFKNGKIWKTEQEMYTYRALDKRSLQKIMSMPQDGMIFEDPSFMSVATKKSSTYQFLNLKNFNHIMRIKIPKDTPYLKLDDIGHIVVPQAPENEMVLKNGSKLLIKSRNGMIEAEYIQ